MDLHIIEHHPQRVLDALRRGEFDALEIVGEADEREFFERLFREKLLAALAATMPGKRKKEEVPRWFILAGNLSLKLHQENSYLAFERVIRCGGLLSALPPELAGKRLDPKTQALLLYCRGFNDKNDYPRKTPCHHDTLRKAAKRVPAQRWLDWYNGPVQATFQQYGFFDPAGVFVGDGSYLFVPDNPNYEGSCVLWFDEHNHPVEYAKLSAAERKKAHRERCYKLVTLLHLRGTQPCYVYAAVALVSGNAHELPVFAELLETFVNTVGRGVLKKLLLDRAFLDGERISHWKRDLGLDVIIPIKKNMDLWTDAWALGQREPWREHPVPTPVPPPPPPQRPEHLIRREAQRQRTLAERKAQAPASAPERALTGVRVCAIKDFNSWSSATVPLHVALFREAYTDGSEEAWALLTTGELGDGWPPRQDYHRRTDIEERHRQLKCFYDLTDFRSRSLNAIAAQVVMILLSYTLRQWQLWQMLQEQLADHTPDTMRFRLALRREYVVIYHQNAYTQMPLVRFSRELLQLDEAARRKALSKVQHLEESMLEPLDLWRNSS
jgi:hypothetical protein